MILSYLKSVARLQCNANMNIQGAEGTLCTLTVVNNYSVFDVQGKGRAPKRGGFCLQILHRDLKPDNLLLSTPGRAGDIRVCDFGLTKLASTLLPSCLTLVSSAALVYVLCRVKQICMR